MNYRKAYAAVKIGDYVRLRSSVETNGGSMMAEGTVMRVFKKHKGLHLESIGGPCKTCGLGIRIRVRHLSMFDVDHIGPTCPKELNAET